MVLDGASGDNWVDFDVEREMEIDRLEQEIPQRRTVNHWVTSN